MKTVAVKRLFATFRALSLASVFLGLNEIGRAASLTWTGGSGDWFEPANWSPAQAPSNTDSVTIGSGSVLLTNSTANLASFTLSGGTLTCSNWATVLYATNVIVSGSGILTHSGPFTTSEISNRVAIVCDMLTVGSGGSIAANGVGYAPGGVFAAGYGPGGGLCSPLVGYGNGAGHGGWGGVSWNNRNLCPTPPQGGCVYGSITNPVAPGSGGGGGNNAGGAGGGAIYIQATGMVTNDGTISANGVMPTFISDGMGGPGSGGSVLIQCLAMQGSGVIRANGGPRSQDFWVGAGGGGRISVQYNSAAQNVLPRPSILYQAWAEYGFYESDTNSTYQADIGTIALTDDKLLPANLAGMTGQVWGIRSLAANALTISNAWMRFISDGFQLIVTNDLTLRAGAKLELGGGGVDTNYCRFKIVNNCVTGPTLQVGGSLILTNDAILSIYAVRTNGTGLSYGALIDIGGSMILAGTSRTYSASHRLDGGSPLFRMDGLLINASAGLDATKLGYGSGNVSMADGVGPGRGIKGFSFGYAAGGGYGGRGGDGYPGSGTGGSPYGSSNAPVDPGSGSSASSSGPGGYGGGLVRIEARGCVTLDGFIAANGENYPFPFTGGEFIGGGGSGGGIYLQCNTFEGNGGILQANGGNAAPNGGAGGGGRIAVWRVRDNSSSIIAEATTGTGYIVAGAPEGGTVVWGDLPGAGTMFLFQ